MKPTVSVVIPHYNDIDHLRSCLASLLAQQAHELAVEIIVSDNGSSVDLAPIAGFLGARGRIVNAPERGAGAARNIGASAATGDILAFIDSDCVADPYWLARGVAALDHHDIVTGRIDVSVANPVAPSPSEAFELVFAFDNRRYVEQEGFAVTASLFVRRADFARIGGFRPLVSEDKEWCQRATAKGFRLGYVHEVAISHPARRTFSELRRKWQRLGTESYHLARERQGGALKWWIRSLLLPASALAASGRVVSSPKLTGLGQRLGALGVLVAIRCYRFVQAQALVLRPPQRQG